MIYDPYLWFTPGYIIHCGIKARKKFSDENVKISGEISKALNESYAAAVACLGFNKLLGKEFRLQLVSPKEQSPDIRVSFEVAAPADSKYKEFLHYWDIEIVTLDEHSPEQNVDDFLKRTKFAATKSYDKETIILCYINKDIVNGKSWMGISNGLCQLALQNSTFLLGKIHPTEFRYHLACVHPKLDSPIEIDVKKDAEKPYAKSGGTLFANLPLPGQKTTRKQRAGINPFLES